MNKTKKEVRLSAQYNLQGIAFTKKDDISFDNIPVSNPSAYDILKNGEENPFEFLVEVKIGENFPATDGAIYTKEWADSYIAGMSVAPYPGSKFGHDALEDERKTVENHTYVVGGKIMDDETMILRHYIPAAEDKLIREVKAGLKATSVVDLHELTIVYNEQTEEWDYSVTKSLGHWRNDIIERERGGMATKIALTSQKAILNKPQEEEVMSITYKEAINFITAQKEEPGFSSAKLGEDLGKALGFDILKTSQKETLDKVSNFEKSKGKNVFDYVEELEGQLSKNFEETKSQRLKEKLAGQSEIVCDAVKFMLTGMKAGSKDEIEKEIDSALNSDFVKKAAQLAADPTAGTKGSTKIIGAKTIESLEG